MDVVKELYVIRDIVADEFGPVFEAKNEGTAKREFLRVIEKVYNPRDYVLIRIGYLDKSMNLIPEIHIIVTEEKENE